MEDCGLKKTLCNQCEHAWVCKYRDAFLQIFEEVDLVVNGTQFTYELKCPNFTEKKNFATR